MDYLKIILIILFDNRGIGQTTTGNETIITNDTAFTIGQFANDTADLIDALRDKGSQLMCLDCL